MLNWSDGKIQHLRAWARSGNPFMELIAKSKLAALDGDLETAGQILDEVLDKYAGKWHERDFLEHIWAISIIARRFDVAARLVTERLAAGWRVEIRPTPPIKHLGGRVKWILPDDKTMLFEFNEDVFASDHTEYYLLSWIYCLPLFAVYSHDADPEQGWVDLNLDDGATVPGLAFCEARRDCFLIPDRSFLHWNGYQDVARQYRQDDVPWAERQPVALWRGSTTGRPEDPALGWRSLPRVRLCQIARAPTSLDLIDAGITAIAQIYDADSAAELQGSDLMRPNMPPGQFNRYKYQIDIDGNSNSWPGLFYKLLTGSPVLKVASPRGYRQWYYSQLKPWINFVPVASDLSDLLEKIVWLRAHDEAARRIGEQGRVLVESLDYEGELKRAGRTITAAIRYAARRPEVALHFGVGANGNECLREGWAAPGKGGSPALGVESRLEIPVPVTQDDFVLKLALSPSADAPAPAPQRVTVVVNGEVLHQTALSTQPALSTRQIMHCLLPQRAIRSAETLSVTLLHPDGVPAASMARPLDERVLSVTLHAMELVPSTVHHEAVRDQLPIDTPATSTRMGESTTVRDQAPTDSSPAAKPMDELAARFYSVSPYEGFDPRSHPDDLSGSGVNPADPLFEEIIRKLSPGVIVEVGSWLGASAIHMAKIVKSLGLGTRIICVDTWLGSPEHFLGSRPEWREKLRQQHGYPRLYYTFLANVVRQGVQDVILPLPTTSESGAYILAQRQVRPDLVYIDAAQEYEPALRDLRAYWEILSDTGIIIRDDCIGAGWKAVTQAVNEFAMEVGCPLFGKPGKFVLSKDKSRKFQMTIG